MVYCDLLALWTKDSDKYAYQYVYSALSIKDIIHTYYLILNISTIRISISWGKTKNFEGVTGERRKKKRGKRVKGKKKGNKSKKDGNLFCFPV